MFRRPLASDPKPAATVRDVLHALQEARSDDTAMTYRRHGVALPTYGVNASALAAVVKRSGVSTDLATGLWRTGVHDARAVALGVADAALVSKKQLEAWCLEVSDYMLAERLATLVASSAHGGPLAAQWTKRRAEYVSAVGWGVVARLALGGRLPLPDALAYLAVVERTIHGAPNRTRHAMNGALIAIGGTLAGAREEAIRVARAIGKVDVDHGATSCRTPAAEPYIAKMVEHAERDRAVGRAPRERKSGRRLSTPSRRKPSPAESA